VVQEMVFFLSEFVGNRQMRDVFLVLLVVAGTVVAGIGAWEDSGDGETSS
jgi:hypothetical protein